MSGRHKTLGRGIYPSPNAFVCSLDGIKGKRSGFDFRTAVCSALVRSASGTESSGAHSWRGLYRQACLFHRKTIVSGGRKGL